MKEEKEALIKRQQILDSLERKQEKMQTTCRFFEERSRTRMSIQEPDTKAKGKELQTTFEIQRDTLYNEVWENGITRTAKKYGIPFSLLKQACQDANIPLPTQSYWGSLTVGKSVERAALPKSDSNIVSIVIKHSSARKQAETQKASTNTDSNEEKKQEPVTNEQDDRKSFIHKKDQRGGPLFEREILYRELWEYPAVEVAKSYGVSDVLIGKICKKLNVPKPPPGYWAKKKAGQEPEMIPLPKECNNTVYPYDGCPKTDNNGQLIVVSGKFGKKETVEGNCGDGFGFLSPDEHIQLIEAANSICVSASRNKLHWVLQKHKQDYTEWSKQHTRDENAAWPKEKRWNIPEDEPAFWTSVSQKALPRVYSILNALYHTVESLGGKIRKDLMFEIRGEIVPFEIVEGKTQIPHILTKSEQQELERYDKDRLRKMWASKPQIRKYDHIPNGNLTIRITPEKYYRDSPQRPLEMRLSDILLDLFRESETIRIKREKREAEQRKREEEARQRELFRQRQRQEIIRFGELMKEAENYNKACKLRNYITAVESDEKLAEDKKEWIAWAKAKADWLDPLVTVDDPFLGSVPYEDDGLYR